MTMAVAMMTYSCKTQKSICVNWCRFLI